MDSPMRRREFLARLGGTAAAAGLTGALAGQSAAQAPAPASRPTTQKVTIRDLPVRALGRTGAMVPPLGIGLASMGHAFYTPQEYEPVVNAAIDAGVTYLDIAPNYDVSEERLAAVLARRRKEVFLVSKTESPTRDGTLRLIEQSLKRMRTDRLDLCHLHNVGEHPTEAVIGKGGMLEGVRAAKDRGLVRFIGASGHMNVRRFVPVLETGQIDVLMVAMNFVDRHVYNFEERVLPVARKHKMGIVAMKVLGGVQGGWGGYRKKMPGQLIGKYYRYAIRYALQIPDINTIVVGMKTLDELREAVAAVRDHKPFSKDERTTVETWGKSLAAEWGEHFGPVGW